LFNGLLVSEVCQAAIEDVRRKPGGDHSLVVHGKHGKDVEVALNERAELRTVRARSQSAARSATFGYSRIAARQSGLGAAFISSHRPVFRRPLCRR
jgi:hypothetical protein